jgi:hypothetical protein
LTSAARFSAVVATGITQKDKAIAACVDFEQAKQIISSMWVVDPNPPNMQGEGACCQCKEFTGNATGCPHITLYLHLTNVIDVNAILKKIPKKGPGRPARPQHCLAGPEKSATKTTTVAVTAEPEPENIEVAPAVSLRKCVMFPDYGVGVIVECIPRKPGPFLWTIYVARLESTNPDGLSQVCNYCAKCITGKSLHLTGLKTKSIQKGLADYEAYFLSVC